MAFKIGIDVGGTFSDFLLTDDEGNTEIYKTLSTPDDPSIGVMNGLELMSKARNMELSDFLPQVSLISHGTTITTNAVLTGDYAKTGLVTTKGHRDWLQTRRGLKPLCYDPKEAPPEPLVPRRLRQVVEERVSHQGEVLLPLNETELGNVAVKLRDENVEAVAICLLFSFQNNEHEQKVKQTLEKALPGVYVCASSDVLPEVRVYERGSTTVFNAAVGPVLRRYITSLLKNLSKSGFNGILLIMQSNGGMMSPEVAMDFAVNSLLSGPAAGPKAGNFFGDIHNCKDILTIDMGGTSFDVCMIRDGEPEITTELDVGMFRMAAPSIAIHTIGAGGGSIAWIDGDGMFRVGPQSAGASPGPACYNLGGKAPTVTDADLVLGYLNPDYFVGGAMKIYPEMAKEAITESICGKLNRSCQLNLSVEDAAYGIYQIVNTNMAQAVRVASVNKGYDPRGALLVSAGGAGPVHACAIAEELEMSLILVPKISSVFCAAGMLISDIKHDFVRVAHMILLPEHVNVDLINSCLEEMKNEALEVLQKEGIPLDKIKLSYAADIRYEGQFNEITTPINIENGKFTLDSLPDLHNSFNNRHDILYGYSLSGFTQELMTLRLTAEGLVEKPNFSETTSMGKDASSAIKGERSIYYNKTWYKVPIYEGSNMGRDNSIMGPAIIEEATTTIVVPPKWQVTCDRYSNYLIYRVDMALEEIFKKIRQ